MVGDHVLSLGIDERIINAVRQAINRIENQHIIVFSVLLSIAAGIACGQIANEVLNIIFNAPTSNSLHSFLTLLRIFFITPLAILLTTLTIGFAIVTSTYMLVRGVYSSTFTLVYSITDLANLENWKNVLKEVLAPPPTSRLSNKFQVWHIREYECRELYEGNYEYVICKHIYRDPIELEIKSLVFKLETNHIIVTLSLTANPIKVAIFEFYGGLLIVTLASFLMKLRRRVYIEVDLWYEVVENLAFFLDEVRKELENKGIPLVNVVV